MSLPIIQSLWIGKPLSNLEKLCIQSFIDHGHEFHLYVYDDVQGIPEGAVIKDGNAILPVDKIFRHASGSYAPFSDWFRYALLYKNGGWWVDTDSVCIKPFDFTEEIVLHACDDGLYTNTPLRFPKKHPFMQTMVAICAEYKNPEKARFGAVGGPRPITKMILQHGMQQYAKPYFYFGDVNWFSAMNKSFAGGIRLHPDTHSIHFGNASMSKVLADKNAQFDDESLFEQLKRKHNIANAPNARRITSEELHAAMIDKRLYKFERRAAKKKKIGAIVGGCVLVALVLLWWLV